MWNCRGARGPLAVPQLKEIINLYSPNLIFLCETKNQKKVMEKFRKRINYEKCFVIDALGKAGGLTLMWNSELDVVYVNSGGFYIEAKIEEKDKQFSWWFIGVYASTDDRIRREQWRIINQEKGKWGEQWMMAGDLNDILSNEEKWGGSSKDFRESIERNALIALGFDGVT